MRADIQVLRAVAVMLVVLFHLWPERVRAGFIGVDVFFVISGFLISSHLFDEVDRTGTLRLREFWARRIRRLLPIALLVIAVTSVLVLLFLPVSNWSEFGTQAIASVFYSENWVLALNSVNYLNADNPPTAVQQYWSLSVEEQFYILWPLLVLAITLLANKKSKDKISFLLFSAVAILSLASLAFSIYLAISNNPSGYFNTFGRIWEFGLGALCVLFAKKFGESFSDGTARMLQIGGIVLLTIAIILITPEMNFPGWVAILPVVGTGLILISGSGQQVSKHNKVGVILLPAIWLGGISYSLYLWHWPFIVLYPYMFGTELTTRSKLFELGFVILLAWLSTRWIEKPLQRYSFFSRARPSRTFVAALVTATLALLPVMYLFVTVNVRTAHSVEIAENMSENDCFGAMSRITGSICEELAPTPLVPDLALVHDDVPVDANDCKSDTDEVKVCSFGNIGSLTKVALIGDSHAGHWFPAVLEIAKKNSWQLDVYLRSSCTFSTVQRSEVYAGCPIWSRAAVDAISENGPYEIAIISSLAPNLYGDGNADDLVQQGFQSVWSPMIEDGTKIAVIKDTPYWIEDPLTCINAHPEDNSFCQQPQNTVFPTPDLEFLVAQTTPGVSAVDMTPYLCNKETCSTVIGGVIVYSDYHHMTATYSKSLANPLKLSLEKSLRIKLK